MSHFFAGFPKHASQPAMIVAALATRCRFSGFHCEAMGPECSNGKLFKTATLDTAT